ncbi:MAG: AbrB/MazE/SpoVT family DNA-binding domain-containing protein [Ruminococcaceae bacterium]|nr:AbrB/MazE/SpoVT family DNA-binding domain-containing protein [Oscillospiraceae bacterium]
MSEIRRTVDSMGRMVLPVDFRKELGLLPNDDVTVCLENGAIIVRPACARCKLCGKKAPLKMPFSVCAECLTALKAY